MEQCLERTRINAEGRDNGRSVRRPHDLHLTKKGRKCWERGRPARHAGVSPRKERGKEADLHLEPTGVSAGSAGVPPARGGRSPPRQPSIRRCR